MNKCEIVTSLDLEMMAKEERMMVLFFIVFLSVLGLLALFPEFQSRKETWDYDTSITLTVDSCDFVEGDTIILRGTK